MKEGASYLIGAHDYRNFCKMDVGNGVVNFIRNIFDVEINEINHEQDGNVLVKTLF